MRNPTRFASLPTPLLINPTTMKLLVVSCILEDSKTVEQMLKREGVSLYNTITTSEYNDNQPSNLKDGWFGLEKERSNSTIFICFTDNDKAETIFGQINKHNESPCSDDQFPIKAYLINVEKSNIDG